MQDHVGHNVTTTDKSRTVVAIIPARYASTRLPAKALARETGKFLIQHVCERVRDARLIDRAVVATDDSRIVEAVASFGGESVMTRADHVSGTDRVGEAAEALGLTDDAIVLNVQGDEPEIEPASLDRLVETMSLGTERIGTIAAPFPDNSPRSGPGSPYDPNCVKVVVDEGGRALYFSRSPIPFPRDTDGVVDRPSRWLLHMGVYAFRVDTLRSVTGGCRARSSLEAAESLEQLRWLQHGLRLAVVIVDRASVGIDTPEDYAAFVARTLPPAPRTTAEIGSP